MAERLWLIHLKQNTRSHSDFLTWLGEEKEKVQAKYKTVKTWEGTLQLQGEEKALDNILRLAIMQAREERQLAGYKRQVAQE